MLAIICVGLVHAGAFMGLTSLGNKVEMVMQEGAATQLTMHRFQLAGIEAEQKGNAEESSPEERENAEPQKEQLPEEEETPKIKDREEPKREPEPKPKAEPKPEPKPTPPKEELIAAKKRAEHKARKRTEAERKAPPRKPERRVERRPEPKPQAPPAKPKPKGQSHAAPGNAPARTAQTAKSVYSEHEVSVLSKPMPGYPRAARQRRMQGTVALLVNVNEGGTVSSVAIQRSSGHDILDREATKAARGIRLRPYLVNGVPTPIRVRIQYQFKM